MCERKKSKGMEEGTQRFKHIAGAPQLSFLSPLIFSRETTVKRLLCFNGIILFVICILYNKLKWIAV